MFADLEKLLSLPPLEDLVEDGINFKTRWMIEEEFAQRVRDIQNSVPLFKTLDSDEWYVILGSTEIAQPFYFKGEDLLNFKASFEIVPFEITGTTKNEIEAQIADLQASYTFFYHEGLKSIKRYHQTLLELKRFSDLPFQILRNLYDRLGRSKRKAKDLYEKSHFEQEKNAYYDFQISAAYRMVLLKVEMDKRNPR